MPSEVGKFMVDDLVRQVGDVGIEVQLFSCDTTEEITVVVFGDLEDGIDTQRVTANCCGYSSE